MSHKKLRPCIVKVSVLGYFPLFICFTVASANYYEDVILCVHICSYKCVVNQTLFHHNLIM